MSNRKSKATVIINLFGAPGVGKSTLAAYTFALLKQTRPNLDVELVTEFAKQLTWQDRHEDLKCQPYIFGKQLNRMWFLKGKVDVIVTDSPLLLGLLYTDPEMWPDSFRQSIVDISEMGININFLLKRIKKYNPVGRNQTEEESNNIGEKIKEILDSDGRTYYTLDGTIDSAKEIIDKLDTYFNHIKN